MNSKRLCSLALVAIATLAISGCKKQGTTSGDTSDTPATAGEYILSKVDQKAEFVLFESNRSKPSTEDAGFIKNDETYRVGDDNPFNVKPELTVLDEDLLPVSASKWTYDFDISATMDGGTEKVGAQYFSIVNAKNADIQFTSSAIGHKFAISVCPTHIDDSKVASFTKSFTVEVVDGYNVYDAKELGYFDTRDDGQDPDSWTDGIKEIPCTWNAFKTANGLNAALHPVQLVFHKNLKITTADIPADYVYTTAEATQLGDAPAAGSLKDRINLYVRDLPNKATINGNYFGLDISELPLIKRNNNTGASGAGVVSHASLFKVNSGNVEFRNLNITGNGPKATTDADTIYAGGLILCKAGHAALGVSAENIVSRDLFINFMSEQTWPDYDPVNFVINNTKCSNNYNSFIYNWGGVVNATNSRFVSCGGPIVIQDHCGVSDTYEQDDQHFYAIVGNAPTTNFVDCVLENYVAGTEAWFQQFGVAAVEVPQIKSLSDLLYASNLGKVFITDENHAGAVYQVLAAQQKASFFNFIGFNKSSSAEGLVNSPVCGTINITTGEHSDLFNYRQPDLQNPVWVAYAAYAADPSTATQTALIQAGVAAGIEFAPDYSDAQVRIREYLTAIATPHGVIRGLNGNGAPVFDFGADFPMGTIPNASATHLYDALSVAAYAQGQIAAPVDYTLTADQKAALPNYAAIYFQGMMLVMGLSTIGA